MRDYVMELDGIGPRPVAEWDTSALLEALDCFRTGQVTEVFHQCSKDEFCERILIELRARELGLV